jgi:hypothetical protein
LKAPLDRIAWGRKGEKGGCSSEGSSAFDLLAGVAVGVLIIIGELDAAGAFAGFDSAGGILADGVAEEVKVVEAGVIEFLFGRLVDEESAAFEEVESV